MSVPAYRRGIAPRHRPTRRRDRRRWPGQIGAYKPEALLSAIPSLPRPMLERVVASMIEHLDTLDGDLDLEDGDEDQCAAGDDCIEGAVNVWPKYPGDPDDAEDGGDHELTDEREPCPIEGDAPWLPYRQLVTA